MEYITRSLPITVEKCLPVLERVKDLINSKPLITATLYGQLRCINQEMETRYLAVGKLTQDELLAIKMVNSYMTQCIFKVGRQLWMIG